MENLTIDYNGRTFTPISNSGSGEVSVGTIFHYHQEDEMLWAEYAGGIIRKGFMIGRVQPDGRLVFAYHHLNNDGAIRSGNCVSTPERLGDGRLRLHEEWRWNDGLKESGHSVVDEVHSKTF